VVVHKNVHVTLLLSYDYSRANKNRLDVSFLSSGIHCEAAQTDHHWETSREKNPTGIVQTHWRKTSKHHGATHHLTAPVHLAAQKG